jgi:hypothetical protein
VCFFRLHVVIGLQAIGCGQKTQSPDLEEEACFGRRLIDWPIKIDICNATGTGEIGDLTCQGSVRC